MHKLSQLGFLVVFMTSILCVNAFAQQVSQLPKTVVVGDIHGDYKQLVKVLRANRLINKKDNWIGGNNRLVQMGDVVGHGAESLKSIRLLIKLKQQAENAGGRVHVVLGDHEAMHILGDRRFVSADDIASLKDSSSQARLNAQYQSLFLQNDDNEKRKQVDKAHRKAFMDKNPLGLFEHQQAWALSGQLGGWTLPNSAVLKLGGTLFVHGGIAPSKVNQKALALNKEVKAALIMNDEAVLMDFDSPLRYRGWAVLDESPQNYKILNAILRNYGVERMVIAHSPLVPTILPRFGGKVLMVDVGLSSYYGKADGVLVIGADNSLYAKHGNKSILIPTSEEGVIDYLSSVAKIATNKKRIESYRQRLLSRRLQLDSVEAN